APADPSWMQAVANEMNVAEPAFVVPGDGEGGAFGLRWFTPTVEVDLCGHATLATAHILWSEGRVPEGRPVGFETRSGRLTAEPRGDWIVLDLPAAPAGEAGLPPTALAALGVEAVRTGSSHMWHLVEVATEEDVTGADPDFAAMRGFDRGFIVTALSGRDVVCRVFAPAYGVDEDPVTGSAQCVLGPWWAPEVGTDDVTVRQLSARGGVLQVSVRGDRVEVGGQAVTTLRGTLVA
ncbi:MAG TPA: PhzF family phenazine biosynthesis protein, partial [Acidimicrobiales bacterium]|nr:PhzF family phenazine biosynthesis protein [Acidimicrobiales bacterium]